MRAKFIASYAKRLGRAHLVGLFAFEGANYRALGNALKNVSLIASQSGSAHLARTFPAALFVSSEIDPYISPTGLCLPGIGDVAERYFGSTMRLTA